MMLENALGFPVCLMNNPHVQFLIQIGWWSYLYNTSILVLFCCYIPSPFGYVYGNSHVFKHIAHILECLEASIFLELEYNIRTENLRY